MKTDTPLQEQAGQVLHLKVVCRIVWLNRLLYISLSGRIEGRVESAKGTRRGSRLDLLPGLCDQSEALVNTPPSLRISPAKRSKGSHNPGLPCTPFSAQPTFQSSYVGNPTLLSPAPGLNSCRLSCKIFGSGHQGRAEQRPPAISSIAQDQFSGPPKEPLASDRKSQPEP